MIGLPVVGSSVGSSSYQNTAVRFTVPVAGNPAECVHQSRPLRTTGSPIRGSPVSISADAPSCGAFTCEYEKFVVTAKSPVPGNGPPAVGAQLGEGPLPVISDRRRRKMPLEVQPLLS